ncbi:MAG TPA: hypothetical protein VFK02_24495 [Kofleriaceae bacterium]|nr:hypothetical protein [Kofleriaceae bacterium]
MFVDQPEMTEQLHTLREAVRSSEGFYMHWVQLWGWIPDIEDMFRQTRAKLSSTTTLSPRERAVIICATVSKFGDSYCSLAWGKELAALCDSPTTAALIATGDATALTPRERALAHWAQRVVANPSTTTRGDVDALRAAGLTQREIVEATALVAFRVAFAMVNDALGAQPDRELAELTPPEVRSAVTFGRPVGD